MYQKSKFKERIEIRQLPYFVKIQEKETDFEVVVFYYSNFLKTFDDFQSLG